MVVEHNKWLEDVALRLVCVLALDRFGDFVSDEVRTIFTFQYVLNKVIW